MLAYYASCCYICIINQSRYKDAKRIDANK
nr:MAG TPA: hypothetical protein [Caudoviricetes sp.]